MPCGDFKGWEGMSLSFHESSMTHIGDPPHARGRLVRVPPNAGTVAFATTSVPGASAVLG